MKSLIFAFIILSSVSLSYTIEKLDYSNEVAKLSGKLSYLKDPSFYLQVTTPNIPVRNNDIKIKSEIYSPIINQINSDNSHSSVHLGEQQIIDQHTSLNIPKLHDTDKSK